MARFLEQKAGEGAFSPIPVAEGGHGLIGKGRGMVFTAGNAVCCRVDFDIFDHQYGSFRTPLDV